MVKVYFSNSIWYNLHSFFNFLINLSNLWVAAPDSLYTQVVNFLYKNGVNILAFFFAVNYVLPKYKFQFITGISIIIGLLSSIALGMMIITGTINWWRIVAYIEIIIALILSCYMSYHHQLDIIEEDENVPTKQEHIAENNNYTKKRTIKDNKISDKKRTKLKKKKNTNSCFTKIIFLIAIIVLLLSNVIFIILYHKEKSSSKEYEKLYENLAINKYKLNEENDELRSNYENAEEKANFLDDNIVFVLDGYGNVYYTYDCVQKITNGNYSYWAYNKESAISQGYKEGHC
jgi:hypothetical protein